ncbi:hypothetical protein J6S88_04470 [bacterium]|nr:hypothetical protein [bacterium]
MAWNKKITEDNVKTIEWRTYKEKTDEELEKEVDDAYSRERRITNIRNMLILFVCLFLLKDVFAYFINFATPRHASEVVSVTEPVTDGFDIEELPFEERGIYAYKTLEENESIDLCKMAKTSIAGKEVSKGHLFLSNYLPWNKKNKIMERVALFDLGLVWGDLSKPEILKDYCFINIKDAKNRKIYPRLQPGIQNPPIAWTQMGDQFAHIQVIPANPNIMYALIYSKKNEHIKMDGYIVDVYVDGECIAVNNINQFYVGRDIRNGGNMKIMLVEKVQVGNKVYE